ncbi:MAG: OsmC family protein [Elusimicrobia bacterium]|nr:OsmC family protein [Elusimicrobiota bacterium]
MGAPFPHRYEVTLSSAGGSQGTLSAGPRPALAGGPPPEFDGDERRWSPEHLLLASAGLCFMTTFAAIAAKSKLDYSGYESRAEGVLDKTPEGLRFTRITLRVTVSGADPDKAARLFELAKKHCIVSNSLRVPVEVEAAVAAA